MVTREIGLLPRHWEWLSRQPEGASAALRKLVEEAQKKNAKRDELRQAQATVHSFLSTFAGDFENYEEVLRAFYAKDESKFKTLMKAWPKDVRAYAVKLAKPALV